MRFEDKETFATYLGALEPEYSAYADYLWEHAGIRSSEMLGNTEASVLYPDAMQFPAHATDIIARSKTAGGAPP